MSNPKFQANMYGVLHEPQFMEFIYRIPLVA